MQSKLSQYSEAADRDDVVTCGAVELRSGSTECSPGDRVMISLAPRVISDMPLVTILAMIGLCAMRT